MNVIKVLFSVSFFVLLAACQSQPTQQPYQVQLPVWLDNPGNGVVGSSVTHVKGRHFQEQLAITRARQQLAARQGVEVDYVQVSSETVTNDNSMTKVKRVGSEEVTTKTVKAKVIEKWTNPMTREIFVLVVPTNEF